MNRRELIAAIPAVGLGLSVASSATAAPSVTSPAQAAWLRYHEAVRQRREQYLTDPLCQDAVLRSQALYLLQSLETVAFNLYLAPRPQYPALYVQSVYMPFEISWGMPNADFRYLDGFVDGAHTYRIYGKRPSKTWSVLMITRGWYGDESMEIYNFVDFDDLPVAPNGDFEIFLGPNPPADKGDKYWVKLDPKEHNTFLHMREVFEDWARDTPMEVHIEILDRTPGAPITYGEEELAARIAKCEKFFDMTSGELVTFALGIDKKDPKAGNETIIRNKFMSASHEGTARLGGPPVANYEVMVFDIKPDEALIIDMVPVKARYWGIQLGSVWQQAADGFYHLATLNGTQARTSSDGRVRTVVALQDPGVPNWLDPVGVGTGMAAVRWYKADGRLVPNVTKVKLADVRQHLPKDTPVVTPDQRRAEIEARRIGLRRYGQ